MTLKTCKPGDILDFRYRAGADNRVVVTAVNYPIITYRVIAKVGLGGWGMHIGRLQTCSLEDPAVEASILPDDQVRIRNMVVCPICDGLGRYEEIPGSTCKLCRGVGNMGRKDLLFYDLNAYRADREEQRVRSKSL